MEQLSNVARATIIAALKKELEAEEKVYRKMADADLFDVNAKTGAKTFDVALETDDRKVSIGTASVVTKEPTWQITDYDAWANAASDAGLVDFTFRVCPGHEDEVMEAIKAAGLDGFVSWHEEAAKDWAKECVEVAGQLVFKETGEPVEGVALTPGKTYTMLKPKSTTIIRQAAMSLYGSTPMALLEGGQDA